MKNFRIESLILAIGLLLLGICIQKGFKSFAERDRSVNVKGLAEMEVPADKVTWPLMYKSLGNDLNAKADGSMPVSLFINYKEDNINGNQALVAVHKNFFVADGNV